MGSYVKADKLLLFERMTWIKYVKEKVSKISIKFILMVFLVTITVSGVNNSYNVLKSLIYY